MLVLVVWGFYVFLAYRKAKETGRSPIKWAAIAGATFIGTQIWIAVGIGLFVGFGEEVWSLPNSFIKTYSLQITVFSLIACAFTNWLVLRPLNKAQNKPSAEPPPPIFERKTN